VLYGATSGTADFTFDVTGYFVVGTSYATYFTLTPGRILDTRTATGGHKSPAVAARLLLPGDGAGGHERALAAVAVTGTLTVTGPDQAGFLTLGPELLGAPPTASLYFPVNDNRATGLTIKLSNGLNGAGQKLCRHVHLLDGGSNRERHLRCHRPSSCRHRRRHVRAAHSLPDPGHPQKLGLAGS